MKRLSFCAPLVGLVVLPTLLCANVRADEFAVVPTGDAIYSNLSVIARLAPGSRSTDGPGGNLTRYEAALQTARVVVSLTETDRVGRPLNLTRERARALRDLISTLRPELRQLEVDPDAALALLDRTSKFTATSRTAPDDFTPRASLRGGTGTAAPRNVTRSMLGSVTAPDARPDGTLNNLDLQLSPRLRAGAALLALQRETQDPFGDSARAAGFARSSALPAKMGATTGSVSYDFNSWLSVRAGGERRSLTGRPQFAGSLLSAPMFSGAGEATTAGGGVDVNVGPLRLSTDVANVATDTGSRGTRVGGGVGLSAWQNRLSLSAHLSTLKPNDSAALDAVATELNVGLDVTQRLSLGMQYQGLFTDQRSTSGSRVAGGLTLNF